MRNSGIIRFGQDIDTRADVKNIQIKEFYD